MGEGRVEGRGGQGRHSHCFELLLLLPSPPVSAIFVFFSCLNKSGGFFVYFFFLGVVLGAQPFFIPALIINIVWPGHFLHLTVYSIMSRQREICPWFLHLDSQESIYCLQVEIMCKNLQVKRCVILMCFNPTACQFGNLSGKLSIYKSKRYTQKKTLEIMSLAPKCAFGTLGLEPVMEHLVLPRQGQALCLVCLCQLLGCCMSGWHWVHPPQAINGIQVLPVCHPQ